MTRESARPLDLWPGDPRLTLVPAQGAGRGSVVVCPGGGYAGLADHEGRDVGQWLAGLGIDAYVLCYRVAAPDQPEPLHPAPLTDLRRAVRVVRSRTSGPVGALGFSAGGHLVASLSSSGLVDRGLVDPGLVDPGPAGLGLPAKGAGQAPDAIDALSAQTDAAVLGYPVITMTDPHTHSGSRRQLLGPAWTSAQADAMSTELHVSSSTPPTFLWHTAADDLVPVHNSLAYASALAAQGVSFELHVFPEGEHGLGLAVGHPAATWTALCAEWLAGRGFGSGALRA